MVKKKKLTALEEKAKGNDLFKLGDFAGAVERYTKAIEKSELVETGGGGGGKEEGEDSEESKKKERSVYHLNRAQGWLKLGRYPEAESDCTVAISLSSEKSSKAYWRRASARKELGMGAATASGQAGGQGGLGEEKVGRVKVRGRLMTTASGMLSLCRSGRLTRTASSKTRPPPLPHLPPALAPPRLPLLRLLPPLPRPPPPSPAFTAQLTAIHSAHSALSELWHTSRGKIITAWAEISIKDLRVQKCRDAFSGVLAPSLQSQRDSPELKPDTLSQHSHLLDLISSRALRAPSVFAFHLDHVRAQTVLKSRQLPPLPTSSSRFPGFTASSSYPPREKPIGEVMQILPMHGKTYGHVTSVRKTDPTAQREATDTLSRGEACRIEESRLMLERQRVLYTGALRAARALVQLSEEGGGEVDEEAVEEYEGRVKSRDHAGREEYSIERVEETVRGFLGYAEDHLHCLREDVEYVADYVFSTASRRSTFPSFRPFTLWKEALTLLSDLRQTYPPHLGTSSAIPLPPAYSRKIGLVAKLVDAFVDLAFRELTQSVKHQFEEQFRKMGAGEANDEFFAFLDIFGEINGITSPLPRPDRGNQVDPLARAFKSLTKIDPLRNPEKTWQIVASLNELNTLFDAHPEKKSARRLVEGLGEYAEAIELREMLLDSHLPRFNKEWADKSTFLSQVHPLWLALEPCWVKSLQRHGRPLHLDPFPIRPPRDLERLRQAVRQELQSPSGPTLRRPPLVEPELVGQGFGGGRCCCGRGGRDSDGPPPLVEISEDEKEDGSDSDEPPPLVGLEEDANGADEDDDNDDDYSSDEEEVDDDNDDDHSSDEEEVDDAEVAAYAEQWRAAFERAQEEWRRAQQAGQPTPPPVAAPPPPHLRLDRRRLKKEKAAKKAAAAAAASANKPLPGPSRGATPASRRAVEVD
ncbi:hypothetical protein JCM8547_005554 [Rhodosporidiobolus lusitaniae]